MTNVFYVEDMTSLRYAIPFIKTVNRLLQKEILLIYNDSKALHKYNNIKKHSKLFLEICKENDVNTIDQKRFLEKSDIKIKNLFCIENTSQNLVCENYYSFQHGFDWEGLYKLAPDATYIVTEEYFKSSIEALGLKAIVSPIPVVFWDWDFYIQKSQQILNVDQNMVTMFYPESGSHNLFKKVHEKLTTLGYNPYIKQRKKNQSVPKEFNNIFYDDFWYPTESILLPMISNFSVGFGTSAYTDLVHLKQDFIDLCIPDYSKKYYKSTAANLISITDDFYENFCKSKFHNLSVSERLKNLCDYQIIKKFLEDSIKL